MDPNVADAVVGEARRQLEGLPFVHVIKSGTRLVRVGPHSIRGGTRTSPKAGHARALSGLRLSIMGWTPSLHSGALEVDCAFPATAFQTEAIEASRGTLECFAQGQRRRIEEATRRGSTTPWLRDPVTGACEVDHMDCDRHVLEAIVAREGGVDAARLHIGINVAQVIDGETSTSCWVGGTQYGEGIVHGDLRMDGALVHYAGTLPDTVLHQLVGRRLGDVFTLTGRLAERRIDMAEHKKGSTTPMTTISIEGDPVRIGDHLDLMRSYQ